MSRVYAVLGRGEPALYHARRCVEINEANDAREDWELGSAYEAMARASAVAGDRAASDEWKARAVAELAKIKDAEDRQVLEQDIATLAMTPADRSARLDLRPTARRPSPP